MKSFEEGEIYWTK